jgi:hypothetical protein
MPFQCLTFSFELRCWEGSNAGCAAQAAKVSLQAHSHAAVLFQQLCIPRLIAWQEVTQARLVAKLCELVKEDIILGSSVSARVLASGRTCAGSRFKCGRESGHEGKREGVTPTAHEQVIVRHTWKNRQAAAPFYRW